MSTLPREQKTILVTGGAGFIGSHLCERLLKEGHRVICLDDISTGSIQNIHELLSSPDFQFIKHDISEPIDLGALPELSTFKIPFKGIQEIYHLACPSSISQFDKYRQQILRANAFGTINVLEIAKMHGARTVFASSSVVYGPRNNEHPKVSEAATGLIDHLSLRACYDEGKRFSETICATYTQMHKMDIRIARLFRTYGPRMPILDGHLIPDFILSALDNKPMTLFEGGKLQSGFLYVSDAVDGLIRLMRASEVMGAVNLGHDQEWSLQAVAELVKQLTGSTSELVNGPDLLFLSELPMPHLQKAKELLGWLPLVRLEDGLRKTIEYLKANRYLLTIGASL